MRTVLSLLSIILIVVTGLVLLPARPALALSASDYFSTSYTTVLSTTSVSGSTPFQLTVSGTATLKKAISISEATLRGKVIARHQVSSNQVTLNAEYSLTNPIPQNIGESRSSSVTVQLVFPAGSEAGVYNVIGEVTGAEVHLSFWPYIWVDPVTYFGATLPPPLTIGSVTYTPASSGPAVGGGGGNPNTAVYTLGLRSSTLAGLLVDSMGKVQASCQFSSPDQTVTLQVNAGTKLSTTTGGALYFLSAEAVASPAAPSPNKAILTAYQFGPDGAVFAPPVTLTIKYDSKALPTGVAEDKLYIAYYDGTQWAAIPSTVDIATATVSAGVSHFSQFAVMGDLPAPPPPAPTPSPSATVPPATSAPAPTTPAPAPPPPKPAKFELSNLAVTPGVAKPGETVAVSAVASNTGGSTGKYTVVLIIDGAEQEERELTLAAGASEKISFSISRSAAKTYQVLVNELASAFTVQPATPGATAAPPLVPTLLAKLNWWFAGGAIAAVLVIGIFVYRWWAIRRLLR